MFESSGRNETLTKNLDTQKASRGECLLRRRMAATPPNSLKKYSNNNSRRVRRNMIPTIDFPSSATTMNMNLVHRRRKKRGSQDNIGNCNEHNYKGDNHSHSDEDGDDDENHQRNDLHHHQHHHDDELTEDCLLPKLIEKSVIIHKDENGFGLRFKGQCPMYVEHVHENGAAWRAGVRPFDAINKVNGIPTNQLSHKDIILMFKSCTRFVAITLLSQAPPDKKSKDHSTTSSVINNYLYSRQASTYSHRSCTSPLTTYDSCSKQQQFDRTGSCRLANHFNHDAGKLMIPTTTTRVNGQRAGEQQLESTKMATVKDYRKKLTAGKGVERRDSNDSFEGEMKTSGDKRMAVCVFCRNSVDNNLFNSKANNARALDITCSQCQLRYDLVQSSLDNVANRHSQLLATRRPVASPTRSSRIPSSQIIHRDVMMTTNRDDTCQASSASTNASMREQQNRFMYKLGQSASTNSLPLEAAAAATTANKLKQAVASPLANTEHINNNNIQQRPTKLIINKRVEIIREFIDTEKTHTERLRCLDELFYRPLRVGGLMTAEQLRMVFSCHRTLYKIHRQIYRILLSANYGHFYGSEPLIGSALLEIFEGNLKRRLERALNSFCCAQATNVELLNQLTRRDTKVGDFLARVTSQQMVGRLGIKDLLASCFQRLTKYPLLLENLLKATPQAPRDDDDDVDVDDVENDAKHYYLDFASTTSKSKRLTSSQSSDIDHYEDDVDDNNEEDDDDDDDDDDNYSLREEARARRLAEESARRLNTRRMLAISLAEEREFIDRALQQSRQILVKVNEAIRVAVSRQKLKEIWKRTDKYPGVPLIDITKQQVVHEGLLTLRLSKRSFDVYVLLLNDYLIILTREGQDKYRLKFFTPEGKSSTPMPGAGAVGVATVSAAATSNNNNQNNNNNNNVSGGGQQQYQQSVYSPVFVIDEHLTTRDAATDENGFYLLCKRKDDSRIYEFASRSPAERMKWRESIQRAIDRQMSRNNINNNNNNSNNNNKARRASCDSTIMTKSSGDKQPDQADGQTSNVTKDKGNQLIDDSSQDRTKDPSSTDNSATATTITTNSSLSTTNSSGDKSNKGEPTKFVGTISYVQDDEIISASEMELSRIQVDQAIQVSVFDATKTTSNTTAKPAVVAPTT